MLTGICHCGSVNWVFRGQPESATACNCTVCRRYGVLWIYDYDGEAIAVTGQTSVYRRGSKGNHVEFHFCPTCGCVTHWRGIHREADGRRRMAVNIRLSDPDTVANLPIDHFDGLESFDDLGQDGRSVKDLWF